MSKKALVTGISGQDGSYLAEYLLAKGYEVHGLLRNNNHMTNIKHIQHKLKLHFGDLTDFPRVVNVVKKVNPAEVYHLAAQTRVGESFLCPFYTAEVNAIGSHKLMEAVFNNCPEAKLYNASTSEMYGDVSTKMQSENTRFDPVSPYGISKLYAHKMAHSYRKRGFFVCNGILFNHESERRPEYFVTRKIAQSVAAIAKGSKKPITLGNLDAMRDWGHAKDYVRGMYLMMQQEKPDDFVLATGKTHTVREFCMDAFKAADITIRFWGNGIDETGIVSNGKTMVEVSEEFFRPNEVGRLCGDSSKAQNLLDWYPKTEFKGLTKLMVDKELSYGKKV